MILKRHIFRIISFKIRYTEGHVVKTEFKRHLPYFRVSEKSTIDWDFIFINNVIFFFRKLILFERCMLLRNIGGVNL